MSAFSSRSPQLTRAEQLRTIIGQAVADMIFDPAARIDEAPEILGALILEARRLCVAMAAASDARAVALRQAAAAGEHTTPHFPRGVMPFDLPTSPGLPAVGPHLDLALHHLRTK